MRTGLWGLNAGLVLMIFTSLLPVGLFQFEASVTTGMWYARSDEFLQRDFPETLRWIRTFGDVVFIAGAIAAAWEVVILGMWRKGARATPCRLPQGKRERTLRSGFSASTVCCSASRAEQTSEPQSL